MMRALVALLVLSLLLPGINSLAWADGDVVQGKKLFRRCAACHLMDRNFYGPTLVGAFGRKAGAVGGFPYSEAMLASGWVWDEQALDRFFADCRKALPGTRMIFVKMPDAQDRADIIAYLKTLSAS
jgi:cytochrome c